MLVTRCDDSVFMVHFKLARVRHNVLMRHNNCRQLMRHITHSHGSCVTGHGSHGSRVSWVMGHVGHGSQNMTHCQLCYTAMWWLVNWPLMGGLLHLVQRGEVWAGCGPDQSPPWCTKCNSRAPVNSHCTNFILLDVALLPLHYKWLNICRPSNSLNRHGAGLCVLCNVTWRIYSNVRFRVCVQVFRCLHNMAPEYLSTRLRHLWTSPPVIGWPWSSRLSTCETHCFVRRTFICIRRSFELEFTSCLP